MPIFTPPSPALQKAWWKETIVYQIYPRSFKDSNDDGIGDLNGITEKLDYLHGLGIETLWLNPIFASPNADNGYDISDYRQIMPDFGTMEDFDRLLKETHARGMRLLLDLVLNHTSDQHPWFREARTSRENPYYDYYLWWPEEQGHPPYRKSHFDEKGDAWCYNAPTRSYYLHYFARQQPDLNWQSPKVRAEIYDILRFWLDKGVDGFRLDSIPYIAKDTSFPEIDLRKYPDVFPYYSLGPHLHDYLHEMNREVFSRYDCTTVGEGSKTAPEEGWKFIAPERQELDMLYHFGAADIRNETEADDPATGIPVQPARPQAYVRRMGRSRRRRLAYDLSGQPRPAAHGFALRQRRPRVARPVGQNAHDVPAHDAGNPLLAGRRRTGHDQHPIHPHRRVRRH